MAAARSEGVLPFSSRKCFAAMSGLAVSSLSPYFSWACHEKGNRNPVTFMSTGWANKYIALMLGLAVSSFAALVSWTPCRIVTHLPPDGGAVGDEEPQHLLPVQPVVPLQTAARTYSRKLCHVGAHPRGV